MSGRGGRRAGAGRPRIRLADVAEHRFDPSSRRHRDLLDDDDLPAGAEPELVHAQGAFRRSASGSSRLQLARLFQSIVEESPTGVFR